MIVPIGRLLSCCTSGKITRLPKDTAGRVRSAERGPRQLPQAKGFCARRRRILLGPFLANAFICLLDNQKLPPVQTMIACAHDLPGSANWRCQYSARRAVHSDRLRFSRCFVQNSGQMAWAPSIGLSVGHLHGIINHRHHDAHRRKGFGRGSIHGICGGQHRRFSRHQLTGSTFLDDAFLHWPMALITAKPCSKIATTPEFRIIRCQDAYRAGRLAAGGETCQHLGFGCNTCGFTGNWHQNIPHFKAIGAGNRASAPPKTSKTTNPGG